MVTRSEWDPWCVPATPRLGARPHIGPTVTTRPVLSFAVTGMNRWHPSRLGLPRCPRLFREVARESSDALQDRPEQASSIDRHVGAGRFDVLDAVTPAGRDHRCRRRARFARCRSRCPDRGAWDHDHVHRVRVRCGWCAVHRAGHQHTGSLLLPCRQRERSAPGQWLGPELPHGAGRVVRSHLPGDGSRCRRDLRGR